MAKKTTDQPMFDQKAYNKTVRALIKNTKKAGQITYDDLTDKVATPYTLDAKQMDKLLETIELLSMNFLLALVIVYLLMVALFGSFSYPFVIMFTVPLAMAGGFIGLALTDAFIEPQPLDVLTMFGFIILIGIVVNNSILIVHQSLNYIRINGYEYKEAIIEATKTRIRPIYMSSLTSIFGMMPLVLIPGPGSEFYRGLGSVMIGGLTFSTIFTIFVTPALLMFFIKQEKNISLNDKSIEDLELNKA